jgi:hypothetical protein
MVESAVESIKEQRRQKEIEKENEMKIFLPKDWMMMDDDEGNRENGNNSLHAIKEHPEEEGEDDERMMMRQIVEEENGRGNEGDEGLNVGRYESIFDE